MISPAGINFMISNIPLFFDMPNACLSRIRRRFLAVNVGLPGRSSGYPPLPLQIRT